MRLIDSAIKIYRQGGLHKLIVEVWVTLFVDSHVGQPIQSLLSAPLFEKLIMAPRLGYWPQIRQPRSFNEKVAHRKIFSRNNLYSTVADKWAVRDFVANEIGGGVLNEVYHVTDDPSSIPFESLPNEFVLKPNHLSGEAILIDGKEELNRESVLKKCDDWLNTKYSTTWNEYWYRDIEPKILIEKRLHGEEQDAPKDYKFYVFHGEVKYIHVDFGRFKNHTRTFYNSDWEKQDFRIEYPIGPDIECPDNFDTMVDVAESLGKEFDFARVDLYQLQTGQVIFGEITLAPGSGREPFHPTESDFKLGNLW